MENIIALKRKKKKAMDRWGVFDYVNILLMLLLCIITLYPFLYLLSMSFCAIDGYVTVTNLIPTKISLESYHKVFTNKWIFTGFYNTLLRTGLGTFFGLIMTICCAYPLSKKYFPNRTFWTAFIVFTMYFSGGMIPMYLVVKQLGLMNSIWSLVLPHLINTYNMIIMRNFFMSIPDSLEESARIDGANDIVILAKIILPVSKPIIATVVLWTAVWHWNAWFDSMIYMRDFGHQVLQMVLRKIVIEGSSQAMDFSAATDADMQVTAETVKAATIMVATIPIICFYPFLQKYFVKGVMIGSLKG